MHIEKTMHEGQNKRNSRRLGIKSKHKFCKEFQRKEELYTAKADGKMQKFKSVLMKIKFFKNC